jgi:hypothetical protein
MNEKIVRKKMSDRCFIIFWKWDENRKDLYAIKSEYILHLNPFCRICSVKPTHITFGVAPYEFSYFLKVTAVRRKFKLDCEQDLFRDTYVILQLPVVDNKGRGAQIS